MMSGEVPLVEADHGPLIDAIASGDPDAAACRMNDHLLMVGDVLAAARAGASS
jgi:DNA-binding FadR family transcriptional regulator